jgi:hypothetical protein
LVAGGLPGEEYCRGLLMKESVWLQVDYLARNIAAAASPQLLDQIIPHIGKAITRTFITRELLENKTSLYFGWRGKKGCRSAIIIEDPDEKWISNWIPGLRITQNM